ncbi:MAG: hypothetical protein JW834_04085 [Candidatus Diapherotrites archaeon]|nr:hypothetical protein [Candidatus Diapherotrites archaeon]
MLKGQLSVPFAIQVTIGFLLLAALTYSVLSLEQDFKKDSQEQVLITASDFIAVQMLSTLEYLEENQTIDRIIRLPMTHDEAVGQYAVSIKSHDGVLYVEAASSKWTDLVARHPLYLNASNVITNDRVSYPPTNCFQASRNSTNYVLQITC